MIGDKITIERMLNDITVDSFESSEDQARAAIAAEALVARLQSPWEQIQKLTWTMPAYIAALKVFFDTGLFEKWDASKACSIDELSEMSGIEKALLATRSLSASSAAVEITLEDCILTSPSERLVRHVAAMNGLIAVGDDKFKLTPFTASLSGGGKGNSSCFQLMFEATWPQMLNLPSFLEKTSYKNPTDAENTNWNDMRQSSEGYIDFVKSTTQRTESFHDMMVAYHDACDHWMDHFPVDTVLAKLKPGRAVLVDIGGGYGYDIELFRKKYSNLPPGSLVLQDLPHVIETAEYHSDIKPMAQDLFKSQPVKGARIYFTHACFHGWSDEDSSQVLKNIAAAMEPGYSRLVMVEKIIKHDHPSVHVTAMDLAMMASLSSNERTEETWQRMLGEAGLKIREVYTSPNLYDSVIEVELACSAS